jgi:hypothetical protein
MFSLVYVYYHLITIIIILLLELLLLYFPNSIFIYNLFRRYIFYFHYYIIYGHRNNM